MVGEGWSVGESVGAGQIRLDLHAARRSLALPPLASGLQDAQVVADLGEELVA